MLRVAIDCIILYKMRLQAVSQDKYFAYCLRGPEIKGQISALSDRWLEEPV